MLAVITWSSLVLALSALGAAILGIVRMRAEDALAARRGRIIMIVGAVAALLFFIVFVVGFVAQRRAAPVASSSIPAVGTPEPPRGLTVRDGTRPRPSGGTVVALATERIVALSPADGVQGRVVSILGAGFGTTPGKVQFIDSRGMVTEATTALPSECTATPWSDTLILVLVPQLPVSIYDVTVERAGGGGVMNRIPFRVTNLGSRTSMCRVDPDHGIPSVTTVTIVGSEFGSSPGKVYFGNVPATHVASWTDSAIQVRVPAGATSGNMRVVTSGGIRSNETPFTIGQCTTTSCAAGQTCCADGLCRGEGTCPAGSGACTYRWFFSTGASLQTPCGPNGSCPTGFRCDAESQCLRVSNPPCGPGGTCAYGRVCDGQTNTCVPLQCGPGDTCPAGLACDRATRTCAATSYPPCGADGSCPSGLACNRATNTCTPNGNPPCAADGSCDAGRVCNAVTRTCDAREGPRACSRDADCTSGQYCSAATGRCTDGTPRLVEEQGCTNTMQSPTPYRGRIDACTNAWFGARFTVPLDPSTVNGNTVEVRACGTSSDFTETACAIRVAGSLETVPGQDGVVGLTMKPLVPLAPGTWYSVLMHRDIRSRVGVPLPQDLEWHARAGTGPCTMDHTEVFPNRAVVASIGDTQGYTALATATNCNLITHEGPYAWESKDATRVAVAPADTRTTVAVALQGTTAAGVSITARVGTASDSGTLVVRLDAPLVADVWPSCAAACRNAELGIRFSLPMRSGTLSSRTVHLDACTDAACTKHGGVPIGAVRGQENGNVFTFAP
ncbi:IPT/TIG domain-containing protein, partial [Candidatus Uhrbacteria bacterium]|nr:IPT/TIG domain-containing protein [Candidatus Uhrbacteria bacterium]